MTVYMCSVCGKPHDSATDPPCPQTIQIPTPAVEAESPDASLPAWKRSYFCPQCPRHAQPKEGFHLIEFVDHVHAHTRAHLYGVVDEARRYDGAIRNLQAVLGASDEWPAHVLRLWVETTVLQARAKPGDSDHEWESMVAKYTGPTEQCQTCGTVRLKPGGAR